MSHSDAGLPVAVFRTQLGSPFPDCPGTQAPETTGSAARADRVVVAAASAGRTRQARSPSRPTPVPNWTPPADATANASNAARSRTGVLAGRPSIAVDPSSGSRPLPHRLATTQTRAGVPALPSVLS